jgi:hypothetical protein
MSHHESVIDHLPAGGERVDVTKLQKILGILPLIGGAGLVGCLVCFLIPSLRGPMAYGWLFAFFYFMTLAMGGLFWTLLHNATNSGWGVAVRRVMEHLACMIPWVLLFALPIILVPSIRNALYEWSALLTQTGGDPEVLHHEHALLYKKLGYLNMPFYYIRMIVYLVALGGAALWLRKLSLAQDVSGDVKLTFRARRISCGLMPAFAVSMTFLAIDFVMCLDYTWFSTMWGVYIFAGCALSGMAVIILTVSGLRNLGYLNQVVNKEHYHLMGKLMKAFVIFWAYISFSQFFLYWYANVTEETKFTLLRNTDGWYALSIFMVVGHFVVPFLFLLRQQAKKDLRQICMGACWLLFVHMLDVYWMIIPERGPSLSSGPSKTMSTVDPVLTVSGAWLLDILAFVTVASCLVYVYLRSIGKYSIYPCRDPRLSESMRVLN